MCGACGTRGGGNGLFGKGLGWLEMGSVLLGVSLELVVLGGGG